MTPLNKKLLWLTLVAMPGAWVAATISAGVITWWHGYASYFVYFMLFMTVVSTPCVFYCNRLLRFFSVWLFISCFLFDVYAMVLLFFPQWNGWSGWNGDGGWAPIYFQLPPDFNYAILLIFFGIVIVFGGKKFFEIDFETMKKNGHKRKEVMQRHVYFIDAAYSKEGQSFELIFKPRFLVKSEHWLHSAAFFIACFVILPLKSLGSVMAGWGNNPFVALAFFVFNYFFLCLCVYAIVGAYAQHRIIRIFEEELGCKLNPGLFEDV